MYKVEGNIINVDSKKGGDILICKDGLAYIVDEECGLVRLKDGYIVAVSEVDNADYKNIGKMKEFICE